MKHGIHLQGNKIILDLGSQESQIIVETTHSNADGCLSKSVFLRSNPLRKVKFLHRYDKFVFENLAPFHIQKTESIGQSCRKNPT